MLRFFTPHFVEIPAHYTAHEPCSADGPRIGYSVLAKLFEAPFGVITAPMGKMCFPFSNESSSDRPCVRCAVFQRKVRRKLLTQNAAGFMQHRAWNQQYGRLGRMGNNNGSAFPDIRYRKGADFNILPFSPQLVIGSQPEGWCMLEYRSCALVGPNGPIVVPAFASHGTDATLAPASSVIRGG